MVFDIYVSAGGDIDALNIQIHVEPRGDTENEG